MRWFVQWSHPSGWEGTVIGPYPASSTPTQSVITVNGKEYDTIAGPYPTQAAAAAYIKANPNGPSSVAFPIHVSAPSLPNPLGWLQGIEHWLGVFVAAVTDIHTWISLGWGVLGMVLLWLGIWWWFRSTETGQRLAQTSMDVGLAAAK